MQLYCPPCQAAFVGANRCPRCGGHLIPPTVGSADPLAAEGPEPLGPPSPINRFVLGTLVALGLYLGFHRIAGGVVLAAVAEPGAWWDSVPGLSTVFGLQSAAVCLGGLLAGAARARGFGTGTLVGAACGGLCLAVEVFEGAPPQQLTLYVQPLLLAVLGGIAAGAGGRIWPAVPESLVVAPSTKTLSSVRLLIGDIGPSEEEEKPTDWVRVAVGAALIACGVLLADQGRTAIQKGTAGLFKVESIGQGKFVSWQLATLAAVLGGMMAGAGTGAGLRHGFFAGFLAASGVVGSLLAIRGTELPAPVAYTLELLTVPTHPFGPAAVALAGVLLAVGMAGGWLGGQLFLPLAPDHMRRGLRGVD